MESSKNQQEQMYKAGLESLTYIPLDTEIAVFGAGRTVCKAVEAFINHAMHCNKLTIFFIESIKIFSYYFLGQKVNCCTCATCIKKK